MDDLIERKRLKEEIESLRITINGLRAGKGVLEKALTAYHDSVIRIIDEQPDAKKDGWIPVEERMPEDGTYICTLDGELCGLEEPFTGMCGIENGIWDEPDCVIAWQPLPEPYRPERRNRRNGRG